VVNRLQSFTVGYHVLRGSYRAVRAREVFASLRWVPAPLGVVQISLKQFSVNSYKRAAPLDLGPIRVRLAVAECSLEF